METEINTIRNWLGQGSINIFGLPYSGKDTIGIRLAEILGGKFLSSGMILRQAEKENRSLHYNLDAGLLAPQDQFTDIVLPYFAREDLMNFPLVLGGVGRWAGEERVTLEAAENAGHPIKAVLLLNISESDIHFRWEQAQILQDRGDRADDRDPKILETRIQEFKSKTMPVINYYREQRLLVPINADQPKEEVFIEVIKKLAEFSVQADVIVR